MNKLGIHRRTNLIYYTIKGVLFPTVEFTGREYWLHVYYTLRVPFLTWYYLTFRKDIINNRKKSTFQLLSED